MASVLRWADWALWENEFTVGESRGSCRAAECSGLCWRRTPRVGAFLAAVCPGLQGLSSLETQADFRGASGDA